MNREQAMDKAVEIVDKWSSEEPKNSKGYGITGWKPPTLGEKVDAAEKLASFLWEVEEVEVLTAPTLSGKDFLDAQG